MKENGENTKKFEFRLSSTVAVSAILRRHLIAVLLSVLLGGFTTRVRADGREDYLIRILNTSQTFRVRSQAAISLGRLKKSRRVVVALGRALRDKHPAVRLAAAASLEHLGDPSALEPLVRVRKDRNKSVRRQVNKAIARLERVIRQNESQVPAHGRTEKGRYYVSVGMPGTVMKSIGGKRLKALRSYLSQRVRSIDGVVLAPEKENRRSAVKALNKKKLIGYAIDSSVVRLEENQRGVRAVISVVLGTYPGRDMRAMLQGAATVPGMSGEQAEKMAIEGAVTSALRNMPQAMQASEARSYHVRR